MVDDKDGLGFIVGPPINLLDLDRDLARAILGDAVYEEAMRAKQSGPNMGTYTVTAVEPADGWLTMDEANDDD